MVALYVATHVGKFNCSEKCILGCKHGTAAFCRATDRQTGSQQNNEHCLVVSFETVTLNCVYGWTCARTTHSFTDLDSLFAAVVWRGHGLQLVSASATLHPQMPCNQYQHQHCQLLSCNDQVMVSKLYTMSACCTSPFHARLQSVCKRILAKASL